MHRDYEVDELVLLFQAALPPQHPGVGRGARSARFDVCRACQQAREFEVIGPGLFKTSVVVRCAAVEYSRRLWVRKAGRAAQNQRGAWMLNRWAL